MFNRKSGSFGGGYKEVLKFMPNYDEALEQRRKEIVAKRKASKKRQRAKSAKRLFILFIIAAIITLCVLSLTIFFPVKNITVKGNSPYTTEQIIKASGITRGKNVFVTGLGAEDDICKKLPLIGSADISRNFSGNIVITVEKAKPNYCYASGNKFLLCDADDKVLEVLVTQPKDTVTVFGTTANNTKAGEKVTFKDAEKKQLFLDVIKILKDKKININSVNVEQKVEIALRVEGRFNVKLGSTAYLEAKINHLSGMIKQTEKDRVGTIDLSDYSPQKPTGILTRE